MTFERSEKLLILVVVPDANNTLIITLWDGDKVLGCGGNGGNHFAVGNDCLDFFRESLLFRDESENYELGVPSADKNCIPEHAHTIELLFLWVCVAQLHCCHLQNWLHLHVYVMLALLIV
jgi:hypothetical protein